MEKYVWLCRDLSLSQTLECGQCFRYQKDENKYTVISGQRVVTLGQRDDSIIFYNVSREDIEYWKMYFHGDGEYGKIKERLMKNDPVMAKAIAFAPGIRLLKQEFFETLMSFIISQNNHIPRIKGLIARLSENYGTPIGDKGLYAFPTAEQLYSVTEEDYRRLGCGFRGRYLESAVHKMYEEGFSREELDKLSTPILRQRLMEICGVGEKVADCVLLFAFSRYEVFPADVWIGRGFSHAYCNGEEISKAELQRRAAERFGELAGFAQQYLFYYTRENKLGRE